MVLNAHAGAALRQPVSRVCPRLLFPVLVAFATPSDGVVKLGLVNGAAIFQNVPSNHSKAPERVIFRSPPTGLEGVLDPTSRTPAVVALGWNVCFAPGV